jgi:hypothetical protein
VRHKQIKATAVATPQLRRAYVVTFVILCALAGCNGGQPTPSRMSPSSGPPSPTLDVEADFQSATNAVSTYERALAGRDWRSAWNWLGDEARAAQTFEEFVSERSAFGRSTKGQFAIEYVRHDAAEIRNWLGSTTIAADLDRAYLARVSFHLLARNNAGWELYVVAPDRSGQWRLWGVR